MATEVVPTGVMSRVPPGYYTRGQAADLIKRHRDTLKRWHENGRYPATHIMHVGETHQAIWLYDDADIAAMKEIVRTIPKGGPMKREDKKAS